MNKLQIRAWYNDGKTQNNEFMLIVYDTQNAADYPIFIDSDHVAQAVLEVQQAPMQHLLEVYNLTGDREAQLAEDRTWRLPNDQNTGRDSSTN